MTTIARLVSAREQAGFHRQADDSLAAVLSAPEQMHNRQSLKRNPGCDRPLRGVGDAAETYCH